MPWESAAPQAGFSAGKPWLPIADAHVARSVDRQEREAGSILAFYREAIALRHREAALQWGEISFIDAPEAILAFTRDDILCVYNLSREVQQWPIPANFQRAQLLGLSRSIQIEDSYLILPPLSFSFLRAAAQHAA